MRSAIVVSGREAEAEGVKQRKKRIVRYFIALIEKGVKQDWRLHCAAR
jgi:hypothetical protein